jgi:hypothetical protein
MRLDRLAANKAYMKVTAGSLRDWNMVGRRGACSGQTPMAVSLSGRYTDVSLADPAGLVTLAFSRAPTDVSPELGRADITQTNRLRARPGAGSNVTRQVQDGTAADLMAVGEAFIGSRRMPIGLPSTLVACQPTCKSSRRAASAAA